MRYSLEPRYRRYVEGQGFMSFARNIGNKCGRKILDKSLDVGKSMEKKYGKKILDDTLSAGKDFAKIAGKEVLTKSAEATGDMIGNKIADRITKSTRNKAQKEDDRIMEETRNNYSSRKKRTNNWRFKIILNIIHTYKMEYDKINNLLLSEDNESEKLSKFVTREYVRVNSLLDTYNKNK